MRPNATRAKCTECKNQTDGVRYEADLKRTSAAVNGEMLLKMGQGINVIGDRVKDTPKCARRRQRQNATKCGKCTCEAGGKLQSRRQKSRRQNAQKIFRKPEANCKAGDKMHRNYSESRRQIAKPETKCTEIAKKARGNCTCKAGGKMRPFAEMRPTQNRLRRNARRCKINRVRNNHTCENMKSTRMHKMQVVRNTLNNRGGWALAKYSALKIGKILKCSKTTASAQEMNVEHRRFTPPAGQRQTSEPAPWQR